MPSGEKLFKIMTQFNFKAYGNELIGTILKTAEGFLPSSEANMLRDFIAKVEAEQRGTKLGVKSELEVVRCCKTAKVHVY